jgi:hypothetical protein
MELGFFSTLLEVLFDGFPIRLKESPQGAQRNWLGSGSGGEPDPEG